MKASEVLDNLKRRFPNEPEYHQAVSEVLGTIEEAYNEHPEFEKSNLIERLCIPDRIFSFRVTWMDDKGQIQTNMGYRIQHNNAIGPYKGGIRFHASVNQSILKFLAFEQTFKNSLTTLPMGGGKGGSDFSPRGKSNAEIMRFCQAFILELWHHIGPDTDVPAGDIGVGGREVAYMYGMYKKLARENTGTFTGKGIEFGGSLIRPEATGYGNVYFLLQMLKTRNIDIKDKVVCVSGSGNVAQYTVEKLISLGAKVVTMSDSDGYIYDPDGIDREKLDYIVEARRRNFKILREGLEGTEGLILPEPIKNSDPSWFGFLISVKSDAGFTRNQLSEYLESKKIQTRNLFAGNLVKHPAFDEMRSTGKGFRIVGELKNTDFVMTNTFWIGVYPGMTEEMLQYMISTIKEFVASHK